MQDVEGEMAKGRQERRGESFDMYLSWTRKEIGSEPITSPLRKRSRTPRKVFNIRSFILSIYSKVDR